MSRKSFVMYESWADMIEQLPDDQALELTRAICSYQKSGEFNITNPVLRVYFETTVKPELDANNQKYQEKVNRAKSMNSTGKNDTDRNRNDIVRNSDDIERNRNDIVRNSDDIDSVNVNVDVDVDDNVDVNVNANVDDNVNNVGVNVSGKEKKKEKRSARSAQPVRHKHGEYGHVMLSDDELTALNTKHGESETQAAIDAVDKYCEKTGKKYKNYKLVLEDWGYSSASKGARSGTTDKPVNSLREKWGISADDL